MEAYTDETKAFYLGELIQNDKSLVLPELHTLLTELSKNFPHYIKAIILIGSQVYGGGKKKDVDFLSIIDNTIFSGLQINKFHNEVRSMLLKLGFNTDYFQPDSDNSLNAGWYNSDGYVPDVYDYEFVISKLKSIEEMEWGTKVNWYNDALKLASPFGVIYGNEDDIRKAQNYIFSLAERSIHPLEDILLLSKVVSFMNGNYDYNKRLRHEVRSIVQAAGF